MQQMTQRKTAHTKPSGKKVKHEAGITLGKIKRNPLRRNHTIALLSRPDEVPPNLAAEGLHNW